MSASPWRRGLALGVLAAACAREPDDSNVVRGRGLRPAVLDAAAHAAVLDAAAHAEFDAGPGLVFMLHPRGLPRTAGLTGGDPMPDSVVAAVRDRGLVRGTCEPQRDAPRNTPRCNVPVAGYLLRPSELWRAGGDTLQLWMYTEKFGAATGRRPEALRMEKILQLVPRAGGWRVVREARVKAE